MRTALVIRAGVVVVAIALAWPAGAAERTATALRNTAPPAASAAAGAAARDLVNRYCVTCHSDRAKTAGLTLEHRDITLPLGDRETWEKVIRKVRAGAMPPANAPRPQQSDLAATADWLETSIDRDAAAAPNPGRPFVHRLNRAEYANAIRDLLGVEIDARALLPADDASYGFDNVADVLTVTPGLLERYLLAAKKISRLAVGDTSVRPSTETYKRPISLLQDERMSEALPFGSRGGIAVRHMFPVDGEYEVRLTLQRQSINISHAVRGMDEENIIHVLIDGVRVREFVIPVTKAREHYDAVQTPDGNLRVRVPVKAGARLIGVVFPQRRWYVEGVGVGRLPAASDAFNSGVNTSTQYGKIEMGIDTLAVTGPFEAVTPGDAASRTRLFTCTPARGAEDACAKAILSRLARRAYRRSVTADDVQTLMGFYREGKDVGGFDRGIQTGIERVLLSPYFLLRKEENPAGAVTGKPYRVSDVELASRLSFFLWSSVPDEELLTAGIAGQLRHPVVLRRQVARMLRDRRSEAFLSNFFGQWLYLRNIDTVKPDIKVFPEFDENLREAFKQETTLFLASQVRDDRSMLDLLSADYTFLNERLARHYGVEGVYGNHFRRVALTGGSRAGLLGQGAILTVTSYADRTSPVVRGKWLLENILASPPPPPPANVPPFPENAGGEQPKSVRARMEMHRKNPVCASCHSRIDPLGFALENFNGVGQYRTMDDGSPIDASGSLPDGTKFNGPGEFRTMLLGQRDQIVIGLTEKLLTYALGRGVEYADMPAVRSIARKASAGGLKWSALIGSLVESIPFQMRRAES